MRGQGPQDPEEFRMNSGLGPTTRRSWFVGFALWALVIGVGTLALLFNPGEFTGDQAAPLIGIAYLTAAIATLTGAVATVLVDYLRAFRLDGRLVGAGIVLAVLLTLPVFISEVVHNFELFDGLPIDHILSRLPVVVSY
ncbi:MAG: hypothetical protein ACI8TL_000468 [Natronomonas sp.]|jgi:hypothetical protein